MSEIRLILREDDEYITVEEVSEGISKTKRIEPDSLTECIAGSLRRSGITSGLLPTNCIAANFNDDGSKSVAILHPELYADLTFYKTEYPNFPIPRMVFGFQLRADGIVTSCLVGVVGLADRLTPDSPLYTYPFSNVSANFHLCTGANRFPKCERLYTMASLPYFVVSMPNNMDHYAPGKNKQGWDLREMLEILKDKTPEFYYSDVLIPNGKTLNDFLKEVAK